MTNKKKQPHEYLVLTPTEEKIVQFLKARKNGSIISQISREINLARTSIYNSINSLIEKNLVNKSGFRYSLLITELKFIGKNCNEKDKINALLKELLELNSGEIIYSIESDEEIRYLLNKHAGLVEWQKAVVKKGIVLKGIGSMEALRFFKNNKNKELDSEIRHRSGAARFIEGYIPSSCVVISFRSSVIFFSREKSYFYRINNKYIAKFIQNIIETLYLKLKYKSLVENET